MAIYRVYKFCHPKTNEIFSEIRNVSDADLPFIASDGVICDPFGIESKSKQFGIIAKDKEVFERYPGYCKEMKPKYVKLRNGSKIRYDPSKHC